MFCGKQTRDGYLLAIHEGREDSTADGFEQSVVNEKGKSLVLDNTLGSGHHASFLCWPP